MTDNSVLRTTSGDPKMERYNRASEDAKKLPPKLLTNSQRLRLYALFKQAEGPAPAQAPNYFNAIARAKWEAWNDCRSLSAEQAMESYCAIIEGLVAITQGAGPPGPPARRQADTAPAPAPAAPAAAASAANAAAKPAAAPATTGAPASEEPDVEPAVDTQRWAATALSLGPGAVFEVPIVVAEPSVCRYCFHVAAADGSVIGFTIGLAGEPALVTARGAQGEGEVDVVSSGQMLIARLDNNASVFSHTVVACEVLIDSLDQLAARDAYRERAVRRAKLDEAKASLVSMQDEMAEVATENSLLRDELSELQTRLEANVTKLTELEAKREKGQAEATRLEASLA